MEDEGFPPGFFDRADEGDAAAFYVPPRFVTHIDDDAIAAVGKLYEELGVEGDVLDLMSSWVSHFRTPPARLRVLGMNAAELEANAMAAELGAEGPEDHVPCAVAVLIGGQGPARRRVARCGDDDLLGR